MKNNIGTRLFMALLAALVMMGGFSIPAYAGGGPEEEETTVAVTETEETTSDYEPQALTPEGNLTLVDDIAGETSGDKQFITVITRNGNYFYIIIDRAEDGENTVHFLNQVDEADLMTLIEDGEFEVQTSVVAPPEPEPTPEPEPEPEPEKSNGMGGALALIIILALGGGGTFYYFKVMKPKQSVTGNNNLDDFDFEDEEDEETEFEVFEDEQEDMNE